MPFSLPFTRVLACSVALGLLGCASVPSSHGGAVVASAGSTTGHMDPMQGAPKEELTWATFSPETFARAKAEHKFVVMDGSAEWCHWCHVMEATTYHDQEVRSVLDARFIAVKVDIDSRPDLQERYGDYGWPATILFSPDAVEIGKYRGYIAPEKFAEILKTLLATAASNVSTTPRSLRSFVEPGGDPGRSAGFVVGASRPAVKTPLSEEHLAWISHATDVELEDYWDAQQGSWGHGQKAPLGWDNAWMLSRAEHDDAVAKEKVLFTLDRQAKLIDPVWGGIYQYSASSDWDHAHFEKLMTFQAPALENYAVAYRLTRDPKELARAKAILGYVDRFMKGPEGGFYTTQDADLNAHDRNKPFLDGHAYYALDEKRRLARGLPRVDTNEYGRENGLAIAAYATMYEVTRDPAVLASAEKAARRILATHATKRGGIAHGPIAGSEEPKLLYLSDNAAFGWGLARLAAATAGPEHDEWAAAATKIADFILAELVDESGGGLFATTADPDAVGVFAARRVPFEDNVMALRLLARLPHDGKRAAAIGRILRAISVPEEIKARGRWLGDYLLALEETKPARR
jgi:hypothetical protein